MTDAGPDSTAERTALWRALHVLVDAPPHVIEDEIGLRLIAPPEDWRERPDMNPDWTRRLRASICARARFVEDLVEAEAARGVGQYVLLGAGLDTFAERRPELAAKLRVFEVDRPEPQEWKRQRLVALGYRVPTLVSVDFEKSSWWERLGEAGFDASKPAVVASTGVTMYLTRDAITATLRQLTTLAPGSTIAMTFLLRPECVEEIDRPMAERAMKGAAGSGTPFVSLFAPDEFVALARDAGLADVRHVAGVSLRERYFAGRADGLAPASGEDFLIART